MCVKSIHDAVLWLLNDDDKLKMNEVCNMYMDLSVIFVNQFKWEAGIEVCLLLKEIFKLNSGRCKLHVSFSRALSPKHAQNILNGPLFYRVVFSGII